MRAFLKKYSPKFILYLYWRIKTTKVKIITFVPRYDEDELLTSHNCDFINEERFKTAFSAAVERKLYVKPSMKWRAHVACWAAENATRIEGDFVECGVHKGFLSYIVMSYIDFNSHDKKCYLFDTFSSFDKQYLNENEREQRSHYADVPCHYDISVNSVIKTFQKFPATQVIKGSVPNTLKDVNIDKVSYLSIDMNCAYPEIEALKFFWDKLSSGAIVILDDYGHAGHEEQKIAFDKLSNEMNFSILSLPTGQGIIIK